MSDISISVNNMLGYRDQWGLITQKDRDGGDTSQRIGLYYSILKLLDVPFTDRYESIEEGYDSDMKMLEISPGIYHRHPNPLEWYSNPSNFSRDQQIILMGAMLVLNDEYRFNDLLKMFKGRYYFHQNTIPNDTLPGELRYKNKVPDFITPMEASLIIRSRNKLSIMDKIKLVFLDSFMLLDNYLGKKNGWDAFNMTCILHIICNKVHPTFMSKLGWKMINKDLAKSQIRSYYTEVNNNGIFPLGELYCILIDKER